jgi:hypothetical protein
MLSQIDRLIFKSTDSLKGRELAPTDAKLHITMAYPGKNGEKERSSYTL